jgi:hypothetical protein
MQVGVISTRIPDNGSQLGVAKCTWQNTYILNLLEILPSELMHNIDFDDYGVNVCEWTIKLSKLIQIYTQIDATAP